MVENQELKIGDSFKVHFPYMKEEEYQEGIVTTIIEEEGEIQYWDETKSIYVSKEIEK